MKILTMLRLVITITMVIFFDDANAQDRYLGNISTNRYDPNSISNPYGQYGSRYSPDSINNPYGQYGSQYSNESANNPYATHVPKLIEQNGAIRIYGQNK
jgi:hypothetical protein